MQYLDQRQLRPNTQMQILAVGFGCASIAAMARCVLEQNAGQANAVALDGLGQKLDEPAASILKQGSQPLLILNNYPMAVEKFNGAADNGIFYKNSRKLVALLSGAGCLMYNYDDKILREICEKRDADARASIGFEPEAEFQASDVKQNGTTTFKVTHRGSTVPVWLEGNIGKEQVYAALAGIALASRLSMNLIEASQAVKTCFSTTH